MIGNNVNSDEGKTKSFWGKMEGKVTLGLIVIAGIFGIKYIDIFMYHVMNILTNIVYSMIALIAIVLMGYLFSSKGFRTALFFLYRQVLRKTVGKIIKIDPIAILKIRIEDAKKEREKINVQIDKVAQQKGVLEKSMKDNQTKAANQLAFAKQAQKQSMNQEDPSTRQDYLNQAGLAAAEAASLEQMNKNFLPLYQKLTKVLELLEKVYKNSDFLIKKTETEVKHKEIEYKVIKASHSALSSALRIFKGDPDKNLVFEQTIEYINNDMGEKLGEMKRAMKLSKDFMTSIDIENGVFNERGMELLEKYNSGELKLLSYDNVSNIELPGVIKQPVTIDITKSNNGNSRSNYENLLD